MGNILTGGENYIHIGKETSGWCGCPHGVKSNMACLLSEEKTWKKLKEWCRETWRVEGLQCVVSTLVWWTSENLYPF